MSRKIEGTFEYKDGLREFSIYEEEATRFIESLEVGAQLSVRTTLARTRSGFNVDLVTPMIGKSLDDKLAARANIVAKMLKVATVNLGPGLAALKSAEEIQATKVGPLSIMLPFAQRKLELTRYYSLPETMAYAYHECELALERILSRIPMHKLKPVSLDVAFDQMPKGTNLGSPFFRKSPDLYPRLIEEAKKVEKSGFNEHEHNDPCMLYWRGQSTGLRTPVKQRAVWGYPHKISLQELRLMVPLIALFKQYPEFSALVSKLAVDEQVSRMLLSNRKKLSVDFSSFDQFAAPLVPMAFMIMRRAFVRSALPMIDFVENRLLNIPLLHPDGIWSGPHGVASGGGPTNWVDSCVNWIIAEAFAGHSGMKLINKLVQGDDGVYEFSDDPNVEEFIKFVRDLGMYAGIDKGGLSSDTVLYLQNVHMTDYIVKGLNVGVRPLERALSGMLGFETPRDKAWRPVDTTFRWFQQIENLRDHPEFERPVRLLYNNDRLVREFSIRELVDLAGGYSELEARQRSKGFPYGKEPLTNVAQFATVKRIAELRKEFDSKPSHRDWWE